MKKLFALSFYLLLAFYGYSGILVIEGNYQGKNLFVQNPFAASGVGFCAYEVRVNGEVTTDEVNSTAFEIDFTNFQLKIGDKVVVTVKHKDDCTPKILNPEALNPKSTFKTGQIYVDNQQILHFKTVGETGVLPFVIEQYRWNKWVRVGELQGVGTPDTNYYKFKVTPHSGENQFRLKQIDYTGRPKYSTTAKYNNPIEPLTFGPIKPSKVINLSSESLYEIYDSYGNIVKRGFGKDIDVSALDKGIYYLSFDNKIDKFVKK